MDFPLFTATGKEDKQGAIYCSSCHNTHQWDPLNPDDKGSKDETGDITNSFLRAAHQDSVLCLGCHKEESAIEHFLKHLFIFDYSKIQLVERAITDSIIELCLIVKEGTHNHKKNMAWTIKRLFEMLSWTIGYRSGEICKIIKEYYINSIREFKQKAIKMSDIILEDFTHNEHEIMVRPYRGFLDLNSTFLIGYDNLGLFADHMNEVLQYFSLYRLYCS